MKQEKIDLLNKEYETKSPEEILKYVSDTYKNVVLTSSLGLEDQLLSDQLDRQKLPIEIVVLDTGRLHKETLDLLTRSKQEFKNTTYNVYTPNETSVQALIQEKGDTSFYESIENRKECCFIRKVEPLTRALKNKDVWITGLRRDQSSARQELPIFEWDSHYKLLKVNPLATKTEQDVSDQIKKHKIPYNPLHDQGYPSIGCEPCTRAIKPGEDSRAGRWWWEKDNQKECGLHVVEGKLVRKTPEKETFE